MVDQTKLWIEVIFKFKNDLLFNLQYLVLLNSIKLSICFTSRKRGPVRIFFQFIRNCHLLFTNTKPECYKILKSLWSLDFHINTSLIKEEKIALCTTTELSRKYNGAETNI